MNHANFHIGTAAAENLLLALRSKSNQELSFYTDCVRSAFEAFEPVFTKERYADFFLHCSTAVPGWIAGAILANGRKESDGAADLLALWRAVQFDTEIEDKILSHSYDECRHSRLFIDLVKLAFPDLLSDAAAAHTKQSLIKIDKSKLAKSEFRVNEEQLIDHLVQMNMGEIRTRIHIRMLTPLIVALAPQENKDRLENILTGLISDEEVHVSYTAAIFDSWCGEVGNQARGRDLYARRLRDFDRYTRFETSAAIAAYGNGHFPDLLEI